MANYLVAKVNTATKSYTLKDTEPSTKPYLKVSNSYLPLQSTYSTTNTGLYVKANNNNYIPVESYTTTRSSSTTTTINIAYRTCSKSNFYSFTTTGGTYSYSVIPRATIVYASTFFMRIIHIQHIILYIIEIHIMYHLIQILYL